MKLGKVYETFYLQVLKANINGFLYILLTKVSHPLY